MIRSIKKFIACSLLIFMCIPAFSQEDTVDVKELIKLSLEDLINLSVSSASKIGQKINEAPSIVSLIQRDKLQQYQWISLNDVTSKQAGYTLGQDRFNRTIVSRGISDLLWSKRLLVLFDGVPYSSFQSSVTDEAFSLNMAKSVEVVRGPGAVLYGSQAVTGVLQVNSLSFDDLRENGEAEIKIGDYGTRNVNVLTGARGKNFNVLFSFNNFSTHGNEYDSYDALLVKDSLGNFTRKRTQDERSSSHFWTKIEGKNKLDGFSLSYHFQNYRFQMGHGFLTIMPDIETSSAVNRNYFMMKYVSPKSASRLKKEYVLKYDYEVTDMNMQIVPAGFKRTIRTGTDSAGTAITRQDSAGIWEQYIVPVNSAFARAQWIYFFDNKMTFLGGIEQDLVYYKGDKLHYSNVDLNSTSTGFLPFEGGKLGNLRPLYESIRNKPVNNTGIYGQYTSGKLLGEKLTATLGGRLDMYYYRYKNIRTQNDTSRFLTHFSPRIVLIYTPKEHLSIRAMYGNAFRVASPFEQFISNSILTGLNTKPINPEEIDTYEISTDWTINKKINLRNTVFYSKFTNQIRASRGAFTNVIGTTQAGLESELQFYLKDVTGFANYSFIRRIKETSTDTAVKTTNSLIWYPAHSVNAGISYSFKKADVTLHGHYQSDVDRRNSEKGAPASGLHKGINMDLFRGAKVASWYTFDVNLNYHITDKLETRLTVNNIFDKQYSLINNLGGSSPQPFDYQQAGRRIMVSLKLNF